MKIKMKLAAGFVAAGLTLVPAVAFAQGSFGGLPTPGTPGIGALPTPSLPNPTPPAPTLPTMPSTTTSPSLNPTTPSLSPTTPSLNPSTPTLQPQAPSISNPNPSPLGSAPAAPDIGQGTTTGNPPSTTSSAVLSDQNAPINSPPNSVLPTH